MDFGSDGLKKQLMNMKKQMGHKDVEVDSYKNELAKLKSDFAEIKKARDEALYQLGQEADKASKNQQALTRTTKELQNYKIQLANADRAVHDASALAATSSKEVKQAELRWEVDGGGLEALKQDKFKLEEKIRSLEKDVSRLREQLEDARSDARIAEANGGGGGSMFGSGAENSRNGNPKAKILDLENQVLTLKAQNKKLEEDSRNAAATPSSTSSTQGFFGSPPPNNRSRQSSGPSQIPRATSFTASSRRESTSLASASTITALEAQVFSLELALSTSEAELEPLKTKLATSQRLVLRLENEKMALERNVKREIEALQTRVDEAEEERDGLQISLREGQGAGVELEKVKKAAERDRERLEGDLRERAESVKRLEGRVLEIEDELESGREQCRIGEEKIKALEKEKKRLASEVAAAPSPPPYPMTPSAPADAVQEKQDEIISNYQMRIVELEAKLSSASTDGGMLRSSLDKSLHKADGEAEAALQRMAKEIKRLKRDKQTLEEDLAASDEVVAEKDCEILALRNNVPLPSSPAHSSSDLPSENPSAVAQHITRSEEEVAAARSTSDQLRSDLAKSKAAVEDLERELHDGLGREESTKNELRTVKKEFEIYKGEMEAFTSQRNAFEADLFSTQQARDKSASQVTILTAEVARLTLDVARQRKDALASSEELSITVENLTEQKTRLEETVRSLEAKVVDVASSEMKVEELGAALSELAGRTEQADGELEAAKVAKRVAEEELEQEKAEIKKLAEVMEVLEEESAKRLRTEVSKAKQLEEEKSTLGATIANLNLAFSTLQDDSSSLRLDFTAAESRASESAARCNALEIMKEDTVRNCIAAENEVERLQTECTRLQDELRDRSTASEADDRDNQLDFARQQIDTLRLEIETLRKESEDMEEQQRKVAEDLKTSANGAREALRTREEEVQELLEKKEEELLAAVSSSKELLDQLETKESELLAATASLESGQKEIADLVEAARVAVEEEAAAVVVPPAAEEDPADRPYTPTPEEIAGVKRQQDALVRIRLQRDELLADKEALQSRLAFSSNETKTTKEGVVKTQTELAVSRQELEEATAIASNAVETTSSLLEQLNKSEAALVTLQTSTQDLTQQLANSNSTLISVQEQHASVQLVVEGLRSELTNSKADLSARFQQVEEIKRERDDLEETRAHLESLESSSGLPVDEALVKLRDELKGVEARLRKKSEIVKIQQHDITRQKAALATANSNLEDLGEELEEANQSLESKTAELETQLEAEKTLKAELETATTSLAELQLALEKAQSDIASKESELASLVLVVSEEKAKSEALAQSLASVESREVEISDKLATLTLRGAELSEKATASASLVEEQASEIAQHEQRIAALTQREAQLVGDLASTNAKLETSATELLSRQQETREQIEDLTRREEELSKSLKSTTAALEAAQVQVDEQKTRVRDFEAELEAATEVAQGATVETEDHKKLLVIAQQEIASLQAKVASGLTAEEALLREKEGLEADVAFRDHKLEALQAEVDQLSHTGVEQEEALREAKEELASLETCRADLAKARQEIARLSEERDELRSTVMEKEEAFVELRRRVEEHESVRGDSEALGRLVETLREEKDQLFVKLGEVQEELKTVVASNEETLASLAQAQEAETSLRAEVGSRGGKVESLLAQVTSLHTAHDSLVEAEAVARNLASTSQGQQTQLVDQHSQEVASLRTQIESLSAEIQVMEQTHVELRQNAQSSAVDFQSARSALDETAQKLAAFEEDVVSREGEIESLRSELGRAQSELAGRDRRLMEVEETAKKLDGERTALLEDLETVQRLQEAWETQVRERDTVIARTHTDSESLRQKLVAVQSELAAVRSRSIEQEAHHVAEVARLEKAIRHAQSSQSASGGGSSEEYEELKEKYDYQVAMLTQKSQEAEEADDKLILAAKTEKRLKNAQEKNVKKIDKLTAELKAVQDKLVGLEEAAKAAPLLPFAAAPIFTTAPPPPSHVSSPVMAALIASPSRFSRAPSASSISNYEPIPTSRRSLFSPAAAPSSNTRPIASTRRVSGERASSSVLSPSGTTNGVPQPSRLTFLSSLAPASDPTVPLSAKRSRPAELEPSSIPTVDAIMSPAPAPAATPRRGFLAAKKSAGGGGFTPKRSAFRTVPHGEKENAVDVVPVSVEAIVGGSRLKSMPMMGSDGLEKL